MVQNPRHSHILTVVSDSEIPTSTDDECLYLTGNPAIQGGFGPLEPLLTQKSVHLSADRSSDDVRSALTVESVTANHRQRPALIHGVNCSGKRAQSIAVSPTTDTACINRTQAPKHRITRTEREL